MTPERHKILFPVDFSTRSVLAAPYVKTWVDRLGAALDTLHVVDRDAVPSEQSDELPYLIEKRVADLKHFSDRYFGENVASCTVLAGGIADQIEYLAKREEIDLIMMPRDHQTLATRIFQDSLTAALLERCTASVWTTEHLDEAPVVPRSILCAVHFEQDASLDAQNDRMLQTVRELVSRFEASVAFVYVERESRDLGEGVTDGDDMLEIEPWKMKAQDLFGSPVKLLRKSGDVLTAISDTAKELDADLIVVGRTRPETIGLGRQVHLLKIDHATHRPVLSVW
jgi:nucleotide-binding universal stress UspA family protein